MFSCAQSTRFLPQICSTVSSRKREREEKKTPSLPRWNFKKDSKRGGKLRVFSLTFIQFQSGNWTLCWIMKNFSKKTKKKKKKKERWNFLGIFQFFYKCSFYNYSLLSIKFYESWVYELSIKIFHFIPSIRLLSSKK